MDRPNRKAFIPLGEKRDWDRGVIYGSTLLEVENEIAVRSVQYRSSFVVTGHQRAVNNASSRMAFASGVPILLRASSP